MPRPFWASFSPALQSPMYWPSAGHLIVARFGASICLATASDGAACRDEQAFWPRSWFRRSTLAMPWSRNEAFIIGHELRVESVGRRAGGAAGEQGGRARRPAIAMSDLHLVGLPGFSA